MRTNRKIYLSLFIFILGLSLNAQSVMIKGGVNSSPIEKSAFVEKEYNMNLGKQLGIAVDVPIFSMMELSTDLYYMDKSLAFQFNQSQYKTKYPVDLDNLQLGLHLKFNHSFSRHLKAYARAGVFTSYSLNTSVLSEVDNRAKGHHLRPVYPRPTGADKKNQKEEAEPAGLEPYGDFVAKNRKEEAEPAGLEPYGGFVVKNPKEEADCAGLSVYGASDEIKRKEEAECADLELYNRGESTEKEKDPQLWSYGLSGSFGVVYKSFVIEASCDYDLDHIATGLKYGKLKNGQVFTLSIGYIISPKRKK